jgi:hypothetical protein
MYESFYEELEKLGKEGKKPEPKPLFSAPVTAHEFGHASRHDERKYPGLRHAIETGVRLGGFGGMVGSILAGRPLLAASMAGVGQLPTLVEEAGATMRGLKALKESEKYDEEELKRARNVLLHAGATYLGAALGRVGTAALAGHLVKASPSSEKLEAGIVGTIMGPAGLGPQLGAALAGIGLHQHIDSSPTITARDAEQLKKQIGSVAVFNRLKDKHKKDAGFYLPPDPDRLGLLLSKENLEKMIRDATHKGTTGQARKSVDIGGVFVPAIKKTKSKTAAAKKPKKEEKSFGKRLGKKLGLGAASLAVAAPIAALAMGKKNRGKIKDAWKGFGDVGSRRIHVSARPLHEHHTAGYAKLMDEIHQGNQKAMADMEQRLADLRASRAHHSQARVIDIDPHTGEVSKTKKSSAEGMPHETLARKQDWASVAAALV